MATDTLQFRVDERTFAAAKRTLRDMRYRAQNLQPAWNAFLDWFAHGNRQQFGTQGKRWGTPWRELKPATVRQKRREGWTADILIRDSLLMRSISDRPMNFERVRPHDMSAGTLVRYAIFHHRGAPRANIPARPLWDVQRIQSEGAATSALKTWIVSGEARVTARTQR